MERTLLFLFVFTAAGVVQCGSSSAVYISFWAFEISEHILRNQNLIIALDSYSRQRSIYLDPILIYISLCIHCLFEIHKTAACFPLAFVAGH